MEPLFNLGLLELQLGNWDEAVTMLGHIVQSDLENPEYRVLLARAFMGKGDSVSALAQVNQALKYVPGHEAALALKDELDR